VRSVMQCAKPLGRASVGESVTGIPRGVRERDRARGENCTNNDLFFFGCFFFSIRVFQSNSIP